MARRSASRSARGSKPKRAVRKAGAAAKKAGAAPRAAKASRAAASPPAREPAAAAEREPSSLAALARKLVEATLDETKFSIPDLYSADAVSVEGNGNSVRGHAGLAQKLAMWNQMQEGTKWRARSIALGRNLIVIEWDADVTLRGGRVVQLSEVAVHEIEKGKIVSERFYYDPAALAPPAG